jgi:flagellin-like protein
MVGLRAERKRGISPVIAIVILIGIAVVVGVALSGWVFGMFRSYTKSGGVTILPSESTCSVIAGCSIVVANDGDSPVSITHVWVDSQPVSQFNVISTQGSNTVAPHGQAEVDFQLGQNFGTQDQNVEVQLGLSNGLIISTFLPLGH